MQLAERVRRLGTETAFAVSAEAKAFAQAGKTVYPFHIGDINLPTPENVIEAANKAIKDGKTGYCPNAGIPELRGAIADEINASHRTAYDLTNVAVQPGGKPVIGKFLLSLMNPGDEVLYPNPGFPIYESLIEFHGGTAVPYGFVEGKRNFELDFDSLKKAITPSTRLLIYNNLHNPSGAESSREELQALADLALKHDLYVLNDEAYFDVRFGGDSLSLSSLDGMGDRSVILYTFSKKFAMTGWRLGAAIGPKEVIDVIATINVNDESCTNHYVQWAGVECLRGAQEGARKILAVLKERRDVAVDIVNSIDGVSCYRPNATFYLFPNVTKVFERSGIGSYEQFRKQALEQTGVSFCTRTHFGRELPGETNRYVRLAYSGIDVGQIEEGLSRFKKWAERS